MKIAITGASGFIGKALVHSLSKNTGHRVCGFVRTGSPPITDSRFQITGDLSPTSDSRHLLEGADVLVHTAAITAAPAITDSGLYDSSRPFDALVTLNLARQAAEVGVKRFVFLSSIKVHGEVTYPGQSFQAADPFRPGDLYAESKAVAEKGLMSLASNGGIEIVCIRPPLVYGPGVKGNFRFLLELVANRRPLPFRHIRNRRSFVALDNLTDLISLCIDHPGAANRAFVVSDGYDISTPQLIREIANGLHVSPRLFPLPSLAAEAGLKLLGKRGLAQRIFGNLQVDSKATELTLDWKPRVTTSHAIRETSEWYLRQ